MFAVLLVKSSSVLSFSKLSSARVFFSLSLVGFLLLNSSSALLLTSEHTLLNVWGRKAFQAISVQWRFSKIHCSNRLSICQKRYPENAIPNNQKRADQETWMATRRNRTRTANPPWDSAEEFAFQKLQQRGRITNRTKNPALRFTLYKGV